jgi:hypothetical protein
MCARRNASESSLTVALGTTRHVSDRHTVIKSKSHRIYVPSVRVGNELVADSRARTRDGRSGETLIIIA